MNGTWFMAAVLGLGLSASAGAEDAAKTEPPKDETVKDAPAPRNKSDRRAGELAERYKVPVADVQDLRGKGLGWGEVGHALGIAQKAEVPLAEVMKLRDSGMGWGKIAQNYGFKLGEVAGKKPEAGAREGKKGEPREDGGEPREDGRELRENGRVPRESGRGLREDRRERRQEGGANRGGHGSRGRGGPKG